MPMEIRIPKIGVSMTEATLSEWLAANGATVDAGQPIYAIEMDKSTNEIESPIAGTVKHSRRSRPDLRSRNPDRDNRVEGDNKALLFVNKKKQKNFLTLGHGRCNNETTTR